MSKLPSLEIEYLPETEITASSTVTGDLGKLDTIQEKVPGKKGFFLSGGEKTISEESGCILDGTYKLFDEIEKYPAWLGNVLSDTFYQFSTPQKITITAKVGTYINSLLIYFDNVASEYATEIVLTDNVSLNETIINNSYTFIKVFENQDTYSSIDIIFTKWSKKNSLAKVLRIKCGFSQIYNITDFRELVFSNQLRADINVPEFGIISQFGNVKIFDKDFTIKQLVENGLIVQDILIYIYFNGQMVGKYRNSKLDNTDTSNLWKFEFSDTLTDFQEQWFTGIGVSERNLYQIVNIILPNIVWENNADIIAQSINIPKSYLVASSRWQALHKCCQVGLMQIYMNTDGNVAIRRLI